MYAVCNFENLAGITADLTGDDRKALGNYAKLYRSADQAGRKRLRVSAARLTDGRTATLIYDLIDAEEQPQPFTGLVDWRLNDERTALERNADQERELAACISAQHAEAKANRERRDAAEQRRQEAIDAGNKVLWLPDSHAAVVMRRAGVDRLPRLLMDDLDKLDIGTDAGQAIEDALIAAGEIVETILPPDGEAISQTGVMLAHGREDEIRAAAEGEARSWQEYFASPAARRIQDQGFTQYRIYEVEELMCPQTWRRKIRRQAKRASAWLDAALRMARPTSRYCSHFVLDAYLDRRRRGAEWAREMVVAFQAADGSTETISLAEIQSRRQRARVAQAYSMICALDHLGNRMGYTAFFVTLTLPPEFHPFSSGPKINGAYPFARPNPNWDPKNGPKAQTKELNRRWALCRAWLAKRKELRAYWGVLVPEPHQDGTVHAHAMIWLPTLLDDGSMAEDYLRGILDDIAPGRESDVTAFRPGGGRDGRGTAASYVMTYVIKALNDDEADAPDRDAPNDEEHLVGEGSARYRAWKSSREMRGWRHLGIHGVLTILMRLWPRLGADGQPKDEPGLPARARAVREHLIQCQQHTGKAAEGIAAMKAMEGASAVEAALIQQRIDQAKADANDAMIEALRLTGVLPCLTDDHGGGLKLTYEETETSAGRPTRRAIGIADTLTGEEIPLKMTETELMSSADWEREEEVRKQVNLFKSNVRKRLEIVGVTVNPSLPREGDDEEESILDPVAMAYVLSTLDTIVERRDWPEWCQGRLNHLQDNYPAYLAA